MECPVVSDYSQAGVHQGVLGMPNEILSHMQTGAMANTAPAATATLGRGSLAFAPAPSSSSKRRMVAQDESPAEAAEPAPATPEHD